MDEDEIDENDFSLIAPDKFNPYQKHLCIDIKFYIGGKLPLSIGPITLSKEHLVKDVIKHVLTLYRRNKEIKSQANLDIPDVPDVYELRHVDDDSDCSSETDGHQGEFYKPNWELPPLGA